MAGRAASGGVHLPTGARAEGQQPVDRQRRWPALQHQVEQLLAEAETSLTWGRSGSQHLALKTLSWSRRLSVVGASLRWRRM